MPIRIQLRRVKGWRMPENTVSVARPTKWGNPFRIKEYGRNNAIAKFVKLIMPTLPVHELRGKNLACFCPLTWSDGTHCDCHADHLLKAANK